MATKTDLKVALAKAKEAALDSVSDHFLVNIRGDIVGSYGGSTRGGHGNGMEAALGAAPKAAMEAALEAAPMSAFKSRGKTKIEIKRNKNAHKIYGKNNDDWQRVADI